MARMRFAIMVGFTWLVLATSLLALGCSASGEAMPLAPAAGSRAPATGSGRAARRPAGPWRVESGRLVWLGEGAAYTIEVGQVESMFDEHSGLDRMAPIVGSESKSEWRSDETGEREWSSSERYLLSAIGPIVSTYYSYDGYHGVGGWVHRLVETRLLGGYTFDLDAYLEATGQYDPAYRSWSLDRFFVDAIAGERVVLGVQAAGCENRRSTCSIRVERIAIHPPAQWWPWLRAAQRGAGLFYRDMQLRPF